MRRIYAGKTSVGKMDVDLYGDLDDSLFSSGLEQRAVEEVNIPLLAVTNELEEARGKISKLEMQNSALKKNISCLFKTAQLEIQRKDTVIQSLRDKVAAMEGSPMRYYSARQKRGDGPVDEPQPYSCGDGTEEGQGLTRGKENLKVVVATPEGQFKHKGCLQVPSKPSTPKYNTLQAPAKQDTNSCLPHPAWDGSRAPHSVDLPLGTDDREMRKDSSKHIDTRDYTSDLHNKDRPHLRDECRYRGDGRKRSLTVLPDEEHPKREKLYKRDDTVPSNRHYSDHATVRDYRSYCPQGTHHQEDRSQTCITKHARP